MLAHLNRASRSAIRLAEKAAAATKSPTLELEHLLLALILPSQEVRDYLKRLGFPPELTSLDVRIPDLPPDAETPFLAYSPGFASLLLQSAEPGLGPHVRPLQLAELMNLENIVPGTQAGAVVERLSMLVAALRSAKDAEAAATTSQSGDDPASIMRASQRSHQRSRRTGANTG